MQNKKPKYTNSAYNNMLDNLTSDVYLVKSKAKNELFKNIDKDKWVETSNKKINLKQAIDLLLEYKDHPEYQYKNQVYKYDGTIELKKNECNSVRKLIQIEARILKDIFYHAENMFNHLKEFNLEAVKYKRLYKLKIEQNFYHKELLELKDKLKTTRDEWNNLTETDSDTIETFLDARADDGASFTYTPPNEPSSMQFVCPSWSKNMEFSNLATIKATFLQVFEPAL